MKSNPRASGTWVILFKRNSDLPSEEVGGEVVVLDVENDLLFSSNLIGSFIWRELSEPKSLNDICFAIVENFQGAEFKTVESDVTEFIDLLLAKGLARKLTQATVE